MEISSEIADALMQEALREATLAQAEGEIPVGAVIARGTEILAQAHNEVEQRNHSCAHAELLAIERASTEIGNWRLDQMVLCVTLEPCSMCAGAIRNARIPVVVFGTPDVEKGACGSLYDILSDPRLGSAPRVISGVREKECRLILTEFFQQRREKNE